MCVWEADIMKVPHVSPLSTICTGKSSFLMDGSTNSNCLLIQHINIFKIN